jgi:hypothetical protein
VTVPEADVERAKSSYVDQVGFTVAQDHRVDEPTASGAGPPGSPCSITRSSGYIDSLPGSLKGVQFNVDVVAVVHEHLRDHEVPVSNIQEYPWGRFCFFTDPDGNEWLCTNRLTLLARHSSVHNNEQSEHAASRRWTHSSAERRRRVGLRSLRITTAVASGRRAPPGGRRPSELLASKGSRGGSS